MKGHLWICVLGLLCMPAEAILQTWTVSQRPLSALMRVNSSAEITCSTSLSDPIGLYLRRRFPEKDIVYLDLENGLVCKNTTATEFLGRIQITPERQIGAGFGFTLRLSLLGLGDTDLYYCAWSHFESKTGKRDSQSSNGTIVVVTETDPQERCEDEIFVVILILSLNVLAFTILLVLFVGALIFRCRRFKKHFRPARAVAPRRPNSPQHVCPQYRSQHSAYMITSESTLDFRGIL